MLSKHKDGSRVLALLLIFTLLCSLLPFNTAFAKEEFTAHGLTVTEETYYPASTVYSTTSASVTNDTYALSEAENALLKAKAYYENQLHEVDESSTYYGFLAAMRSAGVDLSQLDWQRSPWNEDTVWQAGKEGSLSVTEYAGFILGLLNLGLDPQDFGDGKQSRNLIDELVAQQKEDGSFGYSLYEHVWAMIALDTVGAHYDQARAVNYLVGLQNPNGSIEEKYTWDGVEYADDVTGWSLVALSSHSENQLAKQAIDKAVDYLKSIQLANGDFGQPKEDDPYYYLNPNVNLLAVNISGLIAVGEDLTSSYWTTEEGFTPIDALLSYQLADGSFAWKHGELGVIEYATKDAVLALGEIVSGTSFWKQLPHLDKPAPVYTKKVFLQLESFDKTLIPKQEFIIKSDESEISALDALTYVLKQRGISYQTVGNYMIDSIDGVPNGHFGGWDGWNYLVNGHYSTELLPGEWLVSENDHICFYYGGESSLYPDSNGAERSELLTLVPMIAVQPTQPKAGQELFIEISAEFNVRDLFTDEIIGEKSIKIDGAKVLFNAQEFVTDEKGQVRIPSHLVREGTHTIKVSKDVENSYPQLVRWEVTIEVGSGETGSGGSTTPEVDTVTFSVRGLNNSYIYGPREVKLESGDTPYSLLIRMLPGQVEATGSGSSLYVKKIAGLAEFDHGPGSGWMYAVNGVYPSQTGAGTYLLRPGDVVEWRYTTNLGQDLGAPSGGAGGGGVPTRYTNAKQVFSSWPVKLDNTRPAQELSKTVQVLNAEKLMAKEEALKLQARLAGHFFILEESISPALGGILADSEEELTLTVPAGAIDRPVDFRVEKLKNFQSYNQYGEVLSGVYEFLPAGAKFNEPVMIEIKVPLLIDNLEYLALVWWNEKTKEWIPIPASVDAEQGLVIGFTNHFTKFAVIDKSKLPGFKHEPAWQKVLEQSLAFLQNKAELTEWEAYSLARAGYELPASYLNSLEKLIRENKAEFRKVTDLERIILTLTAAGVDPQQFAGYDLIEKLVNHPNMTMQGANGPAFALVALDSKTFSIPQSARWNREKLIDWLLAQQNEDGGFSLAKAVGAPSDVDMTAMVLQGLAIYQERVDVQEAVEKALAWLSKQQLENGGFVNSDGLENSESVAQVLIALTSLHVDPNDQRFVKAKGDLLSNLLSYAEADGSFSHIRGEGQNNVATEQAILALLAYQLWHEQGSALFDLREKELIQDSGQEQMVYIDEAEISFWAKESVRLAGEYGLMHGVSKDVPRFEPKRTLTRAEFAALIDRLAGEHSGIYGSPTFKDVTEQDWFYPPVARAVEQGWIKGVSADRYEPKRAITREEMAVILARFLQLDQQETVLAHPHDLDEVSDWAKEAVEKVYGHGILVGYQGYFHPDGLVTREMAAVVMVRLFEQFN